jgi:hypothetical protein
VKIIGRIFVILAVFSTFSGLIMVVVNSSGMNAPDFGGGGGRQEIRPGSGDGVRPEGDRNRAERGGGLGDFRWLFGAVQNVIVLAILVTMIVLPKSIFKKRKKAGVIARPH